MNTARAPRRTLRYMVRASAIVVLGLVLATKLGCRRAVRTAPPAVTVAQQVVPMLDPLAPVHVETLVTPVRAARSWASALALNARGGWNFITQIYELHTETPTEFVVVDLETGVTSITEGPSQLYTNANFKVGSELRAANGRIFFPGVENNVWYYDPDDETVKELGSLIHPAGENKVFYQAVFGPDGKLYLGTQSNALPTIVQLDPVTLKARVIGEVGKDRNSYSYAYEMAVDPPWVYVAVGQDPWELAAINIETGASKVLATRRNGAFMKVEARNEGVAATLITNLRAKNEARDTVWCADGKTFPRDTESKPGRLPFRSRQLAPTKRISERLPPEVDLSEVNPDAHGIGRISWRPHGSKAPFRETRFQVKYTSPVNLESLLSLPDGSLLGNAKQYHGFFRFHPSRNSVTFYGPHGPSQGPRAIMDGVVYISGYPKGVLYAFDPAKPWTSTQAIENEALRDLPPNPNVNPRRLGNFRDAGAHYASFLVPTPRGRLYFAGRREREGAGGGIGFHDVATGRFVGHHRGLESLEPQGLVVLDRMQRVVYSGKRGAGTTGAAELVIYDEELNELERAEIEPGMQSTGMLFTTNHPDVIVGLSPEDASMYRYDLVARRVRMRVPLEGRISAMTQRPLDGSIWIVKDSTLMRIDPETLILIPFGEPGSVPENATHLTWHGDDLYMIVQSELRRIRRVGMR